jgi:signal transduction histidine kinase
VVEVADTGIGISAEDQERLFQRFFRAEGAILGAIDGTGLGLAIVKAIVDAHGGDLAVESIAGRGTTFRIGLPLERVRVAA